MQHKISKKKKRKKRSRLQILKDKCWDIFRDYVRRKEKGICFTCGAKEWNIDMGENNWKAMQAGHYIHGVLDYDEMNVHCQCVRCNHFLSGNLGEYTMRLINRYGLEEVERLRIRASMAKKGEMYTEEGLMATIAHYKALIRNLP